MKALVLCTLLLAFAQTERPWKMLITDEHEPGIPMIVSAKVLDASGKPLKAVKVHVYQTDAKGVYEKRQDDRYRLEGTMWTNSEGKFEFRTIRPGRYPGQARGEHFHITLSEGGIPEHMARIDFYEDRPDKLVVSVGIQGRRSRIDTSFAWKVDEAIKGQRMDIVFKLP